MPQYRVSVGFWVHAYEHVEIEAANDAAAIEAAKAKARDVMAARAPPESIDDERRGGIIGYIDRYTEEGGVGDEVACDVEFDGETVTIEAKEKGVADPV